MKAKEEDGACDKESLSYLWAANGAEEDGMGVLCGGEGFVCKWTLVDID